MRIGYASYTIASFWANGKSVFSQARSQFAIFNASLCIQIHSIVIGWLTFTSYISENLLSGMIWHFPLLPSFIFSSHSAAVLSPFFSYYIFPCCLQWKRRQRHCILYSNNFSFSSLLWDEMFTQNWIQYSKYYYYYFPCKNINEEMMKNNHNHHHRQ